MGLEVSHADSHFRIKSLGNTEKKVRDVLTFRYPALLQSVSSCVHHAGQGNVIIVSRPNSDPPSLMSNSLGITTLALSNIKLGTMQSAVNTPKFGVNFNSCFDGNRCLMGPNPHTSKTSHYYLYEGASQGRFSPLHSRSLKWRDSNEKRD